MAENIVIWLAGFVIGMIVSVFIPAGARRFAEALVDYAFARRLESERAAGRQPVDQENAKHNAALNISNQLRMAAIDRRLLAHQEAFTLWRKLFKSMHTDEVHGIVLECQEWWEKNCLYLEPSVSNDFSLAYSSAGSHASLLAAVRGQGRTESVEENWQRIIKPGKTIRQAVSLPQIADELMKGKDAEGDVAK